MDDPQPRQCRVSAPRLDEAADAAEAGQVEFMLPTVAVDATARIWDVQIQEDHITRYHIAHRM